MEKQQDVSISMKIDEIFKVQDKILEIQQITLKKQELTLVMQDKMRQNQEEMLKEQVEMKEQLETFQEEQQEMKKEMKTFQEEQKEIKKELLNLGNTVARIEYEHGRKIDLILDIVTGHTEKLELHDKRFEKDEKITQIQGHKIYGMEQVIKK